MKQTIAFQSREAYLGSLEAHGAFWTSFDAKRFLLDPFRGGLILPWRDGSSMTAFPWGPAYMMDQVTA